MGGADRQTGTAARPWPQRGDFLITALLFSLFVIIGSLLPLRIASHSLAEAWQQWEPLSIWQQITSGRAAWIANILLFLPVGFLFAGACLLDRPSSLRYLTRNVLLFCSLSIFAALLEFAQLWFPDRHPSYLDLLAEIAGATSGMLLWWLAGEGFVEWLRGWAAETTRPSWFDRLLVVYLLVFAFWILYPMDMTVSVGTLFHKYVRGQVHLIPLTDVAGDGDSLLNTLSLVAMFAPIGLLLATWRSPQQFPVRSWWFMLVGGVIAAGGMELLQLTVRSRHVTSTDVLCGTVGIVLGGWFASFRSPTAQTSWRTARSSPTVRCGVCLIGAGLYCLLLTLAYSSLFELCPREVLRKRYENFYHRPLVESSPGQADRTAWELIREGLVFAPLGCLLGCALASIPRRPRLRRAVGVLLFAATVLFAFALEMLQVLLPAHVPDITDAVMYVLGAIVGMTVMTWLLPAVAMDREPQPSPSSTLSGA